MNLGYQADRKAIKREQDRSRGGGKHLQLKAGKTVLRIMPPYSEEGIWFKRTATYFFNIDEERVILSAPQDRSKDPVRTFCKKLFSSGDEKLIELAKKLNPTVRYLVNALIIQDPEEGQTIFNKGVQVLALPVRVKEQLVEFDTDEDAGYADITNVQSGFNVIVEKTGQGLATRYQPKVVRERSNILDFAKERGVDTSSWSVHNLDEFVESSSADALISALKRYLAVDPIALAAGVTYENPLGGATETVAAPAAVQVPVEQMADAPTKAAPVEVPETTPTQPAVEPVAQNATPAPVVPPPPVSE